MHLYRICEVYVVDIIIYICICLVTGTVGFLSIGLSKYVLQIEHEDICNNCSVADKCFSQRIIFKDNTILDEFMLVAYVGSMTQCEHIHNYSKDVLSKIIYFFLNAILVGILFWSGEDCLTCVVFGVSAAMLLALSIVDWNTQYIPVEYTTVVFLCGLIRLFADVSNWWEYVIGLIAVSGFLYIVDKVGTPIMRRIHNDDTIDGVMGDGDIKLMAATGLLLGWKLNFVALGIGCITGSIIHVILMKIKGSDAKLAFGPYLSLGVYITMICGEQLVSWYLNMIGYYSYYQ